MSSAHRFQFFRSGGVDQVSIGDGDDLLELAGLDQKLWVALAMPTTNVAVPADTLACLDGDGDGRIRVQDIRGAIAFVGTTFAKPGDVLRPADKVQLAAIKDPSVVAAAKRMLADLGKQDANEITPQDITAITKAFSETVLNGDGIVIPASTTDPELAKLIENVIVAMGSVVDRSGKPGVDQALTDKFFADVDVFAAWYGQGSKPEVAVLGSATADAHAALVAVRAKVDDFFVRCRVAAYAKFDDTTIGLVDTELATPIERAARTLTASDEQLTALPLARVSAVVRLPLRELVNPAWADRMAKLADAAIVPLLGPRDAITPTDFEAVVAKLAPYQAWRDARPTTKLDALDPAWVAQVASSDLRKRLADLIAADAALTEQYKQISAVSKAVLLQRDFARVLKNFVNFSDFYSKQDGAFQNGTLYLDARALKLCVPVGDAGKHAALAAASNACLLYCDIARKGVTNKIVAAVTNGDDDNLFVGRNGVFYDREGNDWDATITKIVSNPISVRAAFWSPYKKLVRTIEDNVQKRAQAADEASSKRMEATGADVANADKEALAAAEGATPKKPGGSKIDLGTIAAIGVAIGGIGTLFGALMTNLFGLGVWLPFGILAIMLMISGPAMMLAYLKLRRRNLGPILDANGWAINGRARINVAFGAAMTELAKLPHGARRSLDDPFADKRTPWRRWVILVALLGLGGAWYLGKFDDLVPDAITSVAVLGDSAPRAKRQAEAAAAAAAAQKATSLPAKPTK